VQVRAFEGIIDADGPTGGYRILCAEHMPAGSLDPPKPPDAARLPSIHLGEERYERQASLSLWAGRVAVLRSPQTLNGPSQIHYHVLFMMKSRDQLATNLAGRHLVLSENRLPMRFL
jgi:hypothetical protein